MITLQVARNDSAEPLALDKIYKNKQKKEEEQKEKRGECEGGQAPRTDPTPTLRRQKLDEALGKGPVSWGLDGSGPALESRDHDAEDLEGQNHPTQPTARPSPPAPRQEPFVPVVDPKPVPTSSTRPSVPRGATVPLVDVGPSGKAKKAPAKRPASRKANTSEEGGILLPEDWRPTEEDYAYAAEKFSMQRKHVDYFADDMREKAAENFKKSGNWTASFRNWMRKGLEFRKGVLPFVPDKPEPKRKVPLAPLPSAITLEGAERSRQRMLRGESWMPDFSKVGMRLPPLPPDPPELEIWRKEDEAAARDS